MVKNVLLLSTALSFAVLANTTAAGAFADPCNLASADPAGQSQQYLAELKRSSDCE
jgi:hypothetical protein